ncbi:hypothetical protein FIV42_04690 [Persicimonas caeni]|uniref:Peptidase C-terminal archaeal/bacterial domain-containing protein n=1 Tax=Persicimonas caeni TaxID=2292766 RepID=A0A4Y6PP03_PERCE|nr:pre-peptidase C-terminal domain-containing protein [Persicimonas caeni]QDG50058.1 hypothetical protein FIV42_04690 [Persicimonas caeni]QED31279.1 hypothetical protein FRD00_04685 [Persicimonas caeni]
MKRYLLYFFASLALSAGVLACGPSDGGDGNNSSQSCETNEDCAEGAQCWDSVCQTASEDACESDFDCASYEYCAEGSCQLAGCSDDSECSGLNICDASSGRCELGCRPGADMCADGEICNEATLKCESADACAGPSDCRDHEVCDDSASPTVCIPDGTCDTDLHCTRYERYVEDGVDYICQDNTCVEKPPCEGDDQCAQGEICEAGECRAGCRSNDDCLLGEYCNMDELRCVEGCNSDADCEDDEICFDFGDGVRECRYECDNRSTCQDNGSAPGRMDGKVCKDSICQFCQDDTDCFAVEFCDLEAAGSPDGLGLCADLPPECPQDDFGDNHSQANAFEVTAYPFEKTADERPLACRQNSGEWFAISAAPGKVIDVTIEYDTDAGNIDVAIVDAQGNDLAASARAPSAQSGDIDTGLERVQYGVDPSLNGPIDAYVNVRSNVVVGNTPYRILIDVRDPESCNDDGYEENDTFDDATPLSVDTAEVDLEVCGDDVDFYELDVAANQIITVTLQSPPRLGDVDIYLYAQDDRDTIIAESATHGDQERLRYIVDTAQKFVLEVTLPDGGNGVGKALYDLEWTSIPNLCSGPDEPNDACGTATQVQDGTTFTSSGSNSLNICADPDYFVVQLNPLDRLRVTATYDPPQVAGELQMTLFGRDRAQPFADACGNFLQSATETLVSGTTQVQLEIDYQAELGGDFYILASRFSGIRVNYDFEVEVIPGPACDDDSYDENGNNDDAANAVTLDPAQVVNNGPDSALVGQKVCDSNEDWYSITIADGSALTWEIVQDVTQGAIGATLIDSDGTTPVTDGNGDPITLDSNGQINVTNSSGADKTYYLRVQGQDGIPVRNNYWLLTYIDGSGPADAACPDVYENNDDAANAVSLPAGTQVSNLLICGGDGQGDWYKTTVEAGQTITVTADFDTTSATPGLYLYEADDTSSAVATGTATANTYTASFTSARDQEIFYRINTSSGVTGDAYALDVSVSAAPACVDDTFDGNHDSTTAEPLEAPGLYSRLQSCNDEADWYAVNLTSGELFEAYINYDDTRADLDVEIYEPDATTLADSGDTSAMVTPSSDATYYVRVASADPSVSVRLGYDLLLYRDDDLSGSIDPDEGPADRTCPDAYENNDTSADAAEVPAGSYTDLLLCSGNPVNDDDYFSVYVPAGVTLTIDVSFDGTEGNIDLRLFDDTNLRVDNSEQPSSDTETVTVTNSSSIGRDYFVQVLGGASSFQTYYDMDIQLDFGPNNQCAEDSYTGNLDMANAASLTAGAYDLALCENTEDWFTFDIPAGETVEANVELRNRLGNIDVELQDANGTTLASSTTDDNVESLTYTNTDASALTVYLRVYPKGGAFMRNNYDLWLAIGSSLPATPFCPDMYERNDSTTAAASLDIASESQFTGMIACGAETDWYAITLAPSTTYDVDLFFDHTADVDLALELLDANGNAVADTNSTDIVFSNHSSDDDETVSFSVGSSGTYFLGVKNHNAGQGDYHLSIAPQTASCPEDSYEANDNVISARVIGPDLPIRLGLGACSDDDYFKWTAPTDGPVTATVYLDNADVNLGMRVEEYATTTIWKDEGVLTPIDDNRVKVDFTATAGEVYIIQLNRGPLVGESQPSNGAYFLEIK